MERVLIVSLPGLSLADLGSPGLSHVRRLLARSSVAGLSLRTTQPVVTPGGTYATIGAGSRASGVPGVEQLAFGGDERVEGGPAAAAFERWTGLPPGAPVFTLAGPALRADADARHFGTVPGALGQALAAARVHAAVIANGDTSLSSGRWSSYRREASLALVDRRGTLPGGALGRDLLEADPAAPFGIRLSAERVAAGFREHWRRRSVVLLELSDLARAATYGPLAAPGPAATLETATVRHADALLGRVLAHVDPATDAVLVVSGPVAPTREPGLGLAALWAPGWRPGLLESPTTRRPGFVTLVDVAPTVLSLLALDVPPSMEGGPFRVGAPRPDPWRSTLVDADREARFRDRLVTPAAGSLLGLEAALALVATAALRRRSPARARWWLGTAGLATISLLPMTYLAVAVGFADRGVAPYCGFLVLGALALALGARLAGRAHPLDPLIVVLGVLVGLLAADATSGTRLQLSAVFGYSPTVGGRFMGLGNLAYAQLAAAATILAGLLVARRPGRSGRLLALLVLAGALLVDGMPGWGADVGGVLAGVPAFAFTYAALTGRRPRPRHIALAGVVALVVLAGFAALDLSRPPAERTHLARLVASVGAEGVAPLTQVVGRKALASLSTLTRSPWIGLAAVAGGLVAYLALASTARLPGLRFRLPQLLPVLWGTLLLGVLGFALNDSGTAVPGMAAAVLSPSLVYLTARLA